jgi:hypothetical protein
MAAPTLFAQGAQVSGTGNVNVTNGSGNFPAGMQNNDILLLLCETANQEVATPSGWAIVANAPQGIGTAGAGTDGPTRISAFWKRTTGTESNFTVTDPGDHIVLGIQGIRGCITIGDPWDVTDGNTLGTTPSTSITIPGLVTTVPDCLIMALCSHGFDTDANIFSGWANASLASFTAHPNYRTSAANGGGFGIATGIKATPGTVDPTTATLSNTSMQGRLVIAFRPPAVDGATINADAVIAARSRLFGLTAVNKPSAAQIAVSSAQTGQSAVTRTAQAVWSARSQEAAQAAVVRNTESRITVRSSARGVTAVSKAARTTIVSRSTLRALSAATSEVFANATLIVRSIFSGSTVVTRNANTTIAARTRLQALSQVARGAAAQLTIRTRLSGLTEAARRAAAAIVARVGMLVRSSEAAKPISISMTVELATRATISSELVTRAVISAPPVTRAVMSIGPGE